jgi:hypothetical protein
MIEELKFGAARYSEFLENARVHLETIQDVLIIHECHQAKHFRELAEVQGGSKSEYRIVEQRYQFTTWEDWSREEQMANSIATDEASAVNGNCSIPKYCFLTLKKE